MSDIQLETISKAVGPAPWYFETFPSIAGSSGDRFAWLERWVWEPDAKLVVLGPESRPGQYRLAVHMYVRAFLIPPAKVGLWYERNGKIRIFGFDPDRLADFALSELPDEFKDPRKWLHYAIGKPEFDLELDLDLPEGMHRFNMPAALQSMDELLLIAYRPPAAGVQPVSVLLAIRRTTLPTLFGHSNPRWARSTYSRKSGSHAGNSIWAMSGLRGLLEIQRRAG